MVQENSETELNESLPKLYCSWSVVTKGVTTPDISAIKIPEAMFDNSLDVYEITDKEYFEEEAEEGTENEQSDFLAVEDFSEHSEEELEEMIKQRLAQGEMLGADAEVNMEIPDLSIYQEEETPQFSQEEIEEFIRNGGKEPTEPPIEFTINEEIKETKQEEEQQAQEITFEVVEPVVDNGIKFELMMDKPDENSTIYPSVAPISMFQMEEPEKELQNLENSVMQKFESTPKEIPAPKEEISEAKPEISTQTKPENFEDPFDVYKNQNSQDKKFVFAISDKFVNLIDKMNTKERDEFINHALELKVAHNTKEGERARTKLALLHIISVLLTVIIATPLILALANWSINATLENYSYTQKSFENLFKHRGVKTSPYR